MRLIRRKVDSKDRLVLIILSIAVLFFAASILYAYNHIEGNDGPISWPGTSTGWDYSGVNVYWAWGAFYAKAEWNSSPMNFTVNYNQYSNNDLFIYNYPDGNNGFTNVWWNEDDEITQADIYINSYYVYPSYYPYNPPLGAVDGQSIITHELNHILEINKDTYPTNVTMYPSYGPNQTWMRSLEDDDEDGIEELYP